MKFASIAFHVDSLNEAYDFPEGYQDPTFNVVAERFFKLADEYSFKATCFVIGKDLDKEAHRRSVRNWANHGHEIGNHSHTHRYNLGALSDSVIREEISNAHQAILETLGVAPRGFVSPNWSTSRRHLEILQEFGYSYDASLFPSWLRVPVTLSACIKCLTARNGRSFSVINQRHMGYALVGSRHSRVLRKDGKELVLLPLPSNRFRVGCWHTLAFMFGQSAHESILKSCLTDTEHFYYVVHPGDLLDPSEVDPDRPTNLPRLEVPLATKMKLLRSSFDIIASSGRKLVTMSELANIASGKSALKKAS